MQWGEFSLTGAPFAFCAPVPAQAVLRTFSTCACCAGASSSASAAALGAGSSLSPVTPSSAGSDRSARRRERLRQLQEAFLEVLERAREREPSLPGPTVVRTTEDGRPVKQFAPPAGAGTSRSLASRLGLGFFFA